MTRIEAQCLDLRHPKIWLCLLPLRRSPCISGFQKTLPFLVVVAVAVGGGRTGIRSQLLLFQESTFNILVAPPLLESMARPVHCLSGPSWLFMLSFHPFSGLWSWDFVFPKHKPKIAYYRLVAIWTHLWCTVRVALLGLKHGGSSKSSLHWSQFFESKVYISGVIWWSFCLAEETQMRLYHPT